jgi:hypothetical protein
LTKNLNYLENRFLAGKRDLRAVLSKHHVGVEDLVFVKDVDHHLLVTVRQEGGFGEFDATGGLSLEVYSRLSSIQSNSYLFQFAFEEFSLKI